MQYATEIEYKAEYDLVICGGGMTGFAAAVSSARKGLRTAIIEKAGCLGGVATTCGVNHLLGGRKFNDVTGAMDKKTGGIFEELTRKLVERKAAIDPDEIDVKFNPHGWYPRMAAGVPFNDEYMKVLLDEICVNEGVDIYFHTCFIDAIVEEKNITSIILHNKSGLFSISSKVFVDATGDADLAFKSGCETVKGRIEDGLMAPASLEMHLENVDTRVLVEYQNKYKSPKLVEIIQKLREEGIWKFPYDIFIGIQLYEPDTFMINTVRQMNVDGTDGNSLTSAMIIGRKENMELFKIIKKYFPGFKNSRIKKIYDMIGIRETRRIVGKHTITLYEAVNNKKFEDCIASTTYNFDLPDPKEPSYDPMMGNCKNPDDKTSYEYIQIPYRAMLPRPINNLVVAGRCISVERIVLGPVRIMGCCIGMGHAAGLASELAIKNGNNYNEVNVRKLQKNLIDDGCLLPIEGYNICED